MLNFERSARSLQPGTPRRWKVTDSDSSIQGRLKIWTEHSTLILLISKPFEVLLPKVQHIYNLGKNEFSPNLKGIAQKMCLLCPLEVFDVFGRKSKSKAPRAFKFSTKRVPI